VLRQPLVREIMAVLAFKALFLTALYYAFFANPAPAPRGAIFAPTHPSDGR